MKVALANLLSSLISDTAFEGTLHEFIAGTVEKFIRQGGIEFQDVSRDDLVGALEFASDVHWVRVRSATEELLFGFPSLKKERWNAEEAQWAVVCCVLCAHAIVATKWDWEPSLEYMLGTCYGLRFAITHETIRKLVVYIVACLNEQE